MAEFHRHRSGLFLPYKRRPTCIDFFCGCGGFSLGFMQAGFEVVAAVDHDATALMTYMINLGSYPIDIHYIEPSDKERLNKVVENSLGRQKKAKKNLYSLQVSGSGMISNCPELVPVKNVWMGDVRKLSGQDILKALNMKKGEIDCVCGGPPCQGYSTSGKRDILDPRNSLIFDYARLILEIDPKTFVMENVPGILSMVTPEGIPVVDAFCRILADGGFGGFNALKKTLLNTAGAGAALKSKPASRPTGKTESKKSDEVQASLF